jgi:hypothetical protein
MTDQHPITPPLELVQQWWTDAQTLESNDSQEIRFIANAAARWGADQELEASLGWLISDGLPELASNLRAARCPKPPSLKEQALKALDHICVNHSKATDHECTIRRALEALPND